MRIRDFAGGVGTHRLPTAPNRYPPQGDFVDQLAELVVKNYGTSHGVKRSDVFVVEAKKKRHYFGEEGAAEGE